MLILIAYVLSFFADTPSVISMTINGHEANSRQLINEGQINISCLFDKGNPPADCSLLDRNRKQLHHLRSENLLIYSLTVQCQDEWPVLHCEGKGSDKNRSVSLLVKCKEKLKSIFLSLVITEC